MARGEICQFVSSKTKCFNQVLKQQTLDIILKLITWRQKENLGTGQSYCGCADGIVYVWVVHGITAIISIFQHCIELGCMNDRLFVIYLVFFVYPY